VSTGKPVVFKDGPLVRAMRASMAIPTAFTSVNVDTTLFVDGGIVNNFPVELVREMGADIVIGVNVSSSGFDSAEDINNIPGILMQMAMISSLDKLPEQIAGCDIYIHPKLEGYNTASFSSYDAILKIGDEAGDEYYEEFRELAIKLHLNDTLYRGIPMVPQAKVISEIELIGNKLTPDYVILGKLGIEVGDLVTREMIEEGIRTVFGLNNFFKVSYYLSEFKDENVFKLTLNIEEKPPAMLLASVHYDNTFSAGIILNLTMRNILLKGSRAVIEGDISENPKFRFDYLKYMGRYQHFALEGIYDYNLLQIPVYQNGELVDFGTRSQNIIQVKAITTHSLKYSFGIGYQFLNYTDKSKFSFSLEGVDKTRVNYSSIVLSYFRNSMNNRNFPTEGTSLELIANTVFKAAYSATPKQGVDTIYIKVNFNNEVLRIPVSKEELPQLVNELEPSFFTQFYANFKTFKTFSPSFQMIPNFAAGLVISDQSAGKSYDEFGIGGVQRINLLNTRVYGLNYNELYKPNFGLVGLTFQNVLWKNLFIQYGASALAYYDYVPINDLASIDWQSLFDNNTMIGYGFVVRYKSIIGPISAGVSRNTQDPYFRYYFQIGYSFGYSD
jgi:NTE family protein